MEPMTRAEARVAGVKYYYTGKPCMYGHTVARYTSTGGCMSCLAALTGEPLGYDELLRVFIRIDMSVPPEIRLALKKYLIEQCVPAFFQGLGLTPKGLKEIRIPLERTPR